MQIPEVCRFVTLCISFLPVEQLKNQYCIFNKISFVRHRHVHLSLRVTPPELNALFYLKLPPETLLTPYLQRSEISLNPFYPVKYSPSCFSIFLSLSDNHASGFSL